MLIYLRSVTDTLCHIFTGDFRRSNACLRLSPTLLVYGGRLKCMYYVMGIITQQEKICQIGLLCLCILMAMKLIDYLLENRLNWYPRV